MLFRALYSPYYSRMSVGWHVKTLHIGSCERNQMAFTNYTIQRDSGKNQEGFTTVSLYSKREREQKKSMPRSPDAYSLQSGSMH